MRSWAEQSSGEPNAVHAYWMATFTDSQQWRARLHEQLDELEAKVTAAKEPSDG
jgi:hypothetical protein